MCPKNRFFSLNKSGVWRVHPSSRRYPATGVLWVKKSEKIKNLVTSKTAIGYSRLGVLEKTGFFSN
jgi:hypothetical protein